MNDLLLRIGLPAIAAILVYLEGRWRTSPSRQAKSSQPGLTFNWPYGENDLVILKFLVQRTDGSTWPVDEDVLHDQTKAQAIAKMEEVIGKYAPKYPVIFWLRGPGDQKDNRVTLQ